VSVHDFIDRPAWMEMAECRGGNPSVFFQDDKDNTRSAVAKAVCRSCPVQAECLAYAISTGETHGVWGGKSPRERRAIARAYGFRVVPPAECGTIAGYARHVEHHEAVCEACREVRNAYNRERWRATRGAVRG